MWTKGRITLERVCKDTHTQVDKPSSRSHLFPSTGVSLELDPPPPELSSCAAGPEENTNFNEWNPFKSVALLTA